MTSETASEMHYNKNHLEYLPGEVVEAEAEEEVADHQPDHQPDLQQDNLPQHHQDQYKLQEMSKTWDNFHLYSMEIEPKLIIS